MSEQKKLPGGWLPVRSRLEVVEAATGDRQVLQEFDGIIEGPQLAS